MSAVLSRHASRARELLRRLVTRGNVVATSRDKIDAHHHALNLLLRTGLAEILEAGEHVVLKATEIGRREVESWR